jgi:spore coat protein A
MLGPKDTVRVNPREMVEIAMTFAPYPGRYMYHCHILEHEDHDMMRPIVVMPAELMPFMS